MSHYANNLSLTFLTGQIWPIKTGGEKYNFHLLKAAQANDISIRVINLHDMPGRRLLECRFLWRLWHLWACWFLSFKAFQSKKSILLVDVWLAPYLFIWSLFSGKSCLLIVHHLRHHIQRTRIQKIAMRQMEKFLILMVLGLIMMIGGLMFGLLIQSHFCGLT